MLYLNYQMKSFYLTRLATGGHNMKYSTSFCRVDVYKNSFYPVMIRLWNTLPEDIIYSNNLRQSRTSVNFYLTNQSNLPILS